MTDLGQAVTDYLAVRQALGYKFAENAKQLPSFRGLSADRRGVEGHDRAGRGPGHQPTGCTPRVVARRLDMVRGFAVTSKRSTLTPRSRPGRATPSLSPDSPVCVYRRRHRGADGRALPSLQRAVTYGTLIGLLAVTGMRCGEAIRLQRGQHRLGPLTTVVTIWNSKFRKEQPTIGCEALAGAWYPAKSRRRPRITCDR